MIKKIILVYLLSISTLMAGLPPTMSKINGESTYSTTFKTDFGSFTGTRSGTTLTLTGIGAATGTSLALGGTINANAIADFQSTTKAFIAPRMTTVQKNAITSPVAGMEVFDTDLGAKSFYNGTQWISNLSISGDTVYSAALSTSTASGGLVRVTPSASNWISGCTNANPVVCTLTGFTQPPNCSIVNIAGTYHVASLNGANSNSISISTLNPATNALASPVTFSIVCEKSTIDYANSSSSGIISSNGIIVKAGEIIATSSASCPADTSPADGAPVSRTQYAELFTEIGTTHGQGDGSTTFNKPDYRGYILRGVDGTAGRDPDKASRTAMNTGGNTGNNVGSVQTDQYAAHNHNLNLFGGSPSGTGVYLGVLGLTYNTTSNLGTSGAIGNTGGNETRPKNAYVNYCVRTKGSNLAIIPLAGTSTTPGYSGQVDDLVFGFGDTSSTPCTTGTCAYLRQAGNGILSVVFASTGAYTINTRRFYNLIFCTGSLTGASYTIGFLGSGAGPGNSFTIQTGQGLTNLNSWGTVFCKGYY